MHFGIFATFYLESGGLSNIFTIFAKIFRFTRECLSFSLMNLGNSLMVREDEPFCVFVCVCVTYTGIAWAVAFFFLPKAFLGPISGD